MKANTPLFLLTGAMVALALTLSGCSLSVVHNNWERSISKSDAVISAEWDYQNNWPTGGAKYSADVILDFEMTEDQAREMVRMSCSESALFDEIIFEASSQRNSAFAEKRGLEGECSDEEELVHFSRILSVVAQQPESFEADVLVWSYDTRTDYGTKEEVLSPPSIWATTTTAEDLFAFAVQTHAAVGTNDPFDFTGAVDEHVSRLSNTGNEIYIDVPASYDLSSVFPVLAEAYNLDHQGPDTGIVVALKDIETLVGDEAAQVLEFADAAGVPIELRLADNPFGSSSVSETRQQFLTELAELPAVEGTTLNEYATIVATTTQATGINEVFDYFEQNDGEHLSTFNDSFVNGSDKVAILVKPAENVPLTLWLDGGIVNLDELRSVTDLATEILAEHSDIIGLHVTSWPDKIRVNVRFEEHAAPNSIESVKQKLRALLPLSTVDRVSIDSFNGGIEQLS